MIIEVVAGEGYGPLRGVTAIAELVTCGPVRSAAGRLTVEVGLTGQPDGQPLSDERCVYLGVTALRNLIVAAARVLADIDD